METVERDHDGIGRVLFDVEDTEDPNLVVIQATVEVYHSTENVEHDFVVLVAKELSEGRHICLSNNKEGANVLTRNVVLDKKHRIVISNSACKPFKSCSTDTRWTTLMTICAAIPILP